MRLLLPLALAAGCAGSPTPTDPGEVGPCTTTGTAAGDCAADFVLTSADGTPAALSDHAGDRVVLLGAAAW